jgi:hypothetical protein
MFCTVQIIVLVCIFALSVKELYYRLKTGQEWKDQAEPGAAPNGGPATPPASSEVTEGPPSVS